MANGKMLCMLLCVFFSLSVNECVKLFQLFQDIENVIYSNRTNKSNGNCLLHMHKFMYKAEGFRLLLIVHCIHSHIIHKVRVTNQNEGLRHQIYWSQYNGHKFDVISSKKIPLHRQKYKRFTWLFLPIIRYVILYA